MAAMIAAARRPLPLPAMGAAALAFALPVVKVPPVVEAGAMFTALEAVWAGAATVVLMVLATLFGISRGELDIRRWTGRTAKQHCTRSSRSPEQCRPGDCWGKGCSSCRVVNMGHMDDGGRWYVITAFWA
jgi:hypothetical protein